MSGSGTLLYDGACRFCAQAARVAGHIAPQAVVLPWQHANLSGLGVQAADAAAALRWVDANGTVRGGAEAVAHLLLAAGKGWAVLGRALLLPGVDRLAEATYRVVAAHRGHLPAGRLPAGPLPAGPLPTGRLPAP